jgi:hypothetical protein
MQIKLTRLFGWSAIFGIAAIVSFIIALIGGGILILIEPNFGARFFLSFVLIGAGFLVVVLGITAIKS